MALSPTGQRLDWDFDWNSDALEVLLVEDGQNAVTTATEHESVSAHSPVYSPFSDGSTDSGVAAGALLSEEDELLAGLFGPDFPLFSEPCEPAPQSPPDTTSSEVPSSPSPQSDITTTAVVRPSLSRAAKSTNPLTLAPTRQKRRMYEFDFDTDPEPITSRNGKKLTPDQLDRNRKNAEAARQNRQRKKKYLEEMEKDRVTAKADNVILRTKCAELQAKNKKLENEVDYLRSVLANQSTLASLIKNIPGTPGVNLTTSFSRKRPNETTGESSSSASPAKRAKRGSESNAPKSGGVCLHVSKGAVSLEFCAQCSQQAVQS